MRIRVPGKSMHRARLIALALAVLCAANPAASARSALPEWQANLTMTAKAAYDGYFKYGEWLPIWLEIENHGPDLEAEVQVRVPGSWGTTTFAGPASLPAGARKRFPIYVLPNNYSHTLEVELIADNQVLLSRRVLTRPLININYLVGLVTPQRGALSFISAISLPGQERPKTLVDLPLSDLPERPEGLRSFDSLIINDTDTSSLTPGQQAALETWVRQGGHLVIGGGAGAQRSAAGLPETLLPCVPRGVGELKTLPALASYAGAEAIRVSGPFVAAIGDTAPGYVLAEQDGLPLVCQRVIGRGLVDFVALDLAVSPFDAWTGTTAFWERLLSPGAAYPEWLPQDVSVRQMRSGQMTYALSLLPALDLPSIRGLALLLMLYILLVGPVNYLVLRWRRRLHWAWISIPLITLVFSGGAFGLGYGLRGTDLILNRVAVIELRPDGNAGVTSYLGLFSPARRSYQIEVRGSSLLSPLTPDFNPWGPVAPNVGGELTFVQGQPSYVRGLSVNQWSMQTFMTESVWTDLGHVRGELQLKDKALVGTVSNETGHALTDTALILGSRFVRLGDLPPGGELPVTMALQELAGQNLGQSLSYLLFQEQLAQSTPTGPPREAELKRAVVESVFEQGARFGLTSWSIGFAGEDSPGQTLTFIGWLDQAPPEVLVAGRAPAQQTTALLYTAMPYHLPEAGSLSVPPGLIPGGLVKMPLEGGPCGMGGAAIWLGRGEAIFEFRVPQETQRLQVETIDLVIGSDGGGWWPPPDTAIYAWEKHRWLAVDSPILGTNVITDADGLVGEDGQVRVRLSTDSNRGGCLYVELGLEGRR